MEADKAWLGFGGDAVLLSSALRDDAVTSGDHGGVAIETEDIPGCVDAVVGCEGVVYDVVVPCLRYCFLVRERLVKRESKVIDVRHG